MYEDGEILMFDNSENLTGFFSVAIVKKAKAKLQKKGTVFPL